MFLFSSSLKVVGFDSRDLAETNKIFVSSEQKISEYIQFTDSKFVYKTDYSNSMMKGTIALNSKQRQINNKLENDMISYVPYTEQFVPINLISIKIDCVNKTIFDCEQLTNHIKNKLNVQPLMCGQQFVLSYNRIALNFTVDKIETMNNKEDTIGLFYDDTNCIFIPEKNFIQLENQYIKNNLFKKNLDLKQLGIGGLDKEFEIMFRRAFVSRMQKDVAKKMGIKHTKGILLYGPPGCGKTLLARQLGTLLNCEEPIIVSGPELLAGLVGKSEENVRNLFANAIADKSGTKLHLIILDEVDALMKQRGTNRGDAGVGDNVVNQFLSMIDGPKQLDNILLICMTNRKDLIDEAILRAGRIEVHIEIQLPDQRGREEILTIHTKDAITNNYLDKSVSIHKLACLTKNYTGAELECLVKSASQFALTREVDLNDKSNKQIKPLITMNDFTQSLNELIPMFGKISSDIQIITSTPFIFWTQKLEEMSNDILNKILSLNTGNISLMLVWGTTYIGKTKFVSHVTKQTGIPCVKMITPERILKSSESKSNFIVRIFDQCLKAETSILIFDSIERIIEWQQIGPRFNNEILQTIISLMTSQINSNKRITLLFTANSRNTLENLEIFELFDSSYEYPTVITNDEINTHFPELAEKYGTNESNTFSNVSDVFKYMKYII